MLKQRLGWAVGASVLLHLAGLLAPPWSGTTSSTQSLDIDKGPSSAVRVRTLALARPVESISMASSDLAYTGPRPLQEAAAAGLSWAEIHAQATAPTAPHSAQADPDNTYLPRVALSQAPKTLAAVLLDYPSEAPSGRHVAQLTLYIDENGQVQRVRLNSAALPAALMDNARQAFLHTRFTPGEVEGRAVKAQIDVEVEYVADSLPRTMGLD